MRNRGATVNQVEAQAAQEAPILQNRGRGRFRGRGITREQYRERPGITCYYCQVSGHTSRDCPLRIRHQAEKQAELEKSQTNPADVQMIFMDEERRQVTEMLSGLTNVLTVTRAQAKKETAGRNNGINSKGEKPQRLMGRAAAGKESSPKNLRERTKEKRKTEVPKT